MPIFKLTGNNDTFLRTDGSDAGNDTIYGFAGNDILNPGAGSNVVYGGAGNDGIVFNVALPGGLQLLDGGSGDDVIFSNVRSGGRDTLLGGDGNDVLGTGSYTPDVLADYRIALDGGAGDDVVQAAIVNFTAEGGTGRDRFKLFMDLSNDALSFDARGAATLGSLGSHALGAAHGFEDYSVYSGNGNDLIYLGAGNDLADTTGGNDTVYGGAGNDTIGSYADFDGEANGADKMYGGDGNDEIFVGVGFAVASGGAGNDTVRAFIDAVTPTAPVSLTGDAGTDGLDLTLYKSPSLGGTTTVAVASTGTGYTASVNGVQVVNATSFENLRLNLVANTATFTGGNAKEIVSVTAQTATVSTGGGDDTVLVSMNGGLYRLDGGLGSDTLNVGVPFGASSSLNGLFVDMQTSAGVIRYGEGPAGTVTGFEKAYITGSAWRDEIHTGAGDDVIYGGTLSSVGAVDPALGLTDILDGGAGDDYIRSARMPDDVFIEDGMLHDKLYGGTGNDTLIAGRGNDFVYGGTGNDLIYGGLGADTMAGGTGDDVFVFGESGTAVGAIDNINFFVSHAANLAHHDRIDLSAIFDRAAAVHTPMTFIGTAAFTAGWQVRVVQNGPSTFVEINTGGTLDAEMRICLVGQAVAGINATDFIL